MNQPNNQMQHYKNLGLLLTLYLAQGLPSGFVTQALPAILREYHASLVAIGWSGLILLPWGLKFMWAPFVDSHYVSNFGRSRSWILPLQILSIVVLVAVALFNPVQLTDFYSVLILYSLLFVLSLIGATHDVATDGLATRLIKSTAHQSVVEGVNSKQDQEHHRQSQGNAIQVIGYRTGLIIGGGVLLMLLGKIGWQTSFLAMAALVALNTLPIIFYREPVYQATTIPSKSIVQTQSISDFIHYHYQYFWSNREMRAWLGVLLTFKIADGISSGMVKPMMVDIGIGLDKIGFWVTILGSAASLVGAATATVLMKRLSRFHALLSFNFCQAITTGLYGVIAYVFEQQWLTSYVWVYAVNALEHFCASLALIALLTTIMHYSRHEHAGSDFTVQVCLMTVLGGGGHFLSGYMVQYFGYTTHFFISMIIGFACLLLVVVWGKNQKIEK